MNCAQVQALLSAYYDDELPNETRLSVADHLEMCAECSGELAGFEGFSQMADRLDCPRAPENDWSRLERSLDAESAISATRGNRRWPLSTRRFLAMAATILVAMGIGWTGYRMLSPRHAHAAVFGHYLEQFQEDPDKAQAMLLAKYDGQGLDTDNAIQKVGYRPAMADGLPEGYSIDSTFVMEMPCCTCVQTLCRRGDGSILVVFEHDDEQPNWFGARSGIVASCGGKQCSLISLDSQLAASWKRGQRHMTIIGAKDVVELDRLVSWLDGNKKGSS